MLKIVAKLEDVNTSVATIKNMGLTLTSNLQPSCATMAQCQILKDQLMESVAKLKKQNQIFRDLPTLEELLDPVEEHKTGDLPHGFEDGEASIVAESSKGRLWQVERLWRLDPSLKIKRRDLK